jgi:ABC-type uncharacterized transport system permease subunit
MRYQALLITGVLCGLAGAYLSTAQAAGFGREMTAGRGYIALAALIFAKWRPWYAMGTAQRASRSILFMSSSLDWFLRRPGHRIA